VYHLLTDSQETYNTLRREELYNILTEFSTSRKLVKLIKICLNETYSKVHTVKNLSDASPIQYGLEQGDALL